MRRIKIFTAVALIGLMATTTEVLAQRGMGRGMMNNPEGRGMMNNADRPFRAGQCILNLTPEQDSKMAVLRTNHLKEVTPLRNELNEKRARLRSLQSVDKPDLKEINKTIDEMAAIRTNIQKKGAAHRVEVSSQLTDEQRVQFNARKSGRMMRGNMCRGSRGGRMGR